MNNRLTKALGTLRSALAYPQTDWQALSAAYTCQRGGLTVDDVCAALRAINDMQRKGLDK
jgi:hypothetical protein